MINAFRIHRDAPPAGTLSIAYFDRYARVDFKQQWTVWPWIVGTGRVHRKLRDDVSIRHALVVLLCVCDFSDIVSMQKNM